MIDFSELENNPEMRKEAADFITRMLGLRANEFHPLAFINGKPQIGDHVYIGFFSEVNAKDAQITIGDYCDIASFVSINAADSHLKCIGLSNEITRSSIVLENNIFVGSHSFIGGNVHIGHHSVIGAGTILVNGGYIPPYSLVVGNPFSVKEGYFNQRSRRDFHPGDETNRLGEIKP